MKKLYPFKTLLLLFIICARCSYATCTNRPDSLLNVLVLTERGGHHKAFTTKAIQWIDENSKYLGFEYTEINDTRHISDDYLKKFSLIIQLDYIPYTWKKDEEDAFVRYIEEGRGGWIGFHHAALLGDFDGYPMWQWFSDFLGGIRFENYIAETTSGTIVLEDRHHPIMKDVQASFMIPNDEWYTFNKSPRGNVHVLAHVDESTYNPTSNIKMGDHPVIWINENVKSRNVYFLMGHSASLFDLLDFKKMFANAIVWALHK